MDFNDTTNKQGLVQDCDWWVTSDINSYPLADKVRSANMALNEVTGLILSADGRWQFDDTNYTDLPIGTTDLVSNQQDYGIDTSMIDITRVECTDAQGKTHFLIPIDQKDLNVNANQSINSGDTSTSLTDFMSTAGTPIYYDKIGNSIFLYPKPNYNLTGGLKVYFQRKASYFTSSDTTKQPGFAKHLHRYISLSMAKDYAIAKLLAGPKISTLYSELNLMKQNILTFYGRRQKDVRSRLTPNQANNR